MWRNYLPEYRFPEWMTSVNHNLQRYNPSDIILMSQIAQQRAAMANQMLNTPRPQQMATPRRRSNHVNRAHPSPSPQRASSVTTATSTLPVPPHRMVQNHSKSRTLENGQKNLQITVNASPTSTSDKMNLGKRKLADTEDTRSSHSGAKKVKTSSKPPPLATKTAADEEHSSSGEEEEVVDDARSQAERLSKEMLEYMDLHVQKEPDYREKEELRRRLEEAIREIYQRTNLVLVGSSMNGFGRQGSDADFCLVLTLREIDQRFDARYILDQLHSYLKYRCPFIMKSFVIYAKVPIMRFTDRITGLECDININNMTGIRNTHLVQCYSKIDRRVVPLVMWIKHWFKSNGINDASQGTLSSYGIVLLVLHYLQEICSPPVIPSLQEQYPHLFGKNKDIHSVHRSLNSHRGEPSVSFTSRNTQNLGELIVGFFKHVSTFNFTKTVLSVRLGSSFKLPNNWRPQYIHIEEPFERQNVARALHKGFQYEKITAKFKQADKVLCGDLSCSLEDILFMETTGNGEFKTKKSKRQRIREALRFIKNKEFRRKKGPTKTADQHQRFTEESGQRDNGKNGVQKTQGKR